MFSKLVDTYQYFLCYVYIIFIIPTRMQQKKKTNLLRTMDRPMLSVINLEGKYKYVPIANEKIF